MCVDEMSLGDDFNTQTGSRRNTLRETKGQACSKGQDGVLAGTLRSPGRIPIRCYSSEALQGIRGRAMSQGPLLTPSPAFISKTWPSHGFCWSIVPAEDLIR